MGNVGRRGEGTVLTKIQRGNIGGRKSKGKLRKKWLADVEDLIEMGIRARGRKSHDRYGEHKKAGFSPR